MTIERYTKAQTARETRNVASNAWKDVVVELHTDWPEDISLEVKAFVIGGALNQWAENGGDDE